YDYDAFGMITQNSGNTANDYMYAGEQYDSVIGLYYLRARYLNSSTGRFFTLDKFVGIGSDPQTLHKYLYTSNDPINKMDPSGNVEISIAGVTYNLTIRTVIAGIANLSINLGRSALLRVLTLAFLVTAGANSPVLQQMQQEFEQLEGTGQAGIEEVQ